MPQEKYKVNRNCLKLKIKKLRFQKKVTNIEDN